MDKDLISKMNMSQLRALIEILIDEYRDKAFWSGYKEAKNEILQGVVSRQTEKGE